MIITIKILIWIGKLLFRWGVFVLVELWEISGEIYNKIQEIG